MENLYRLSLNPAKQFTARNFDFNDEDLTLRLIEGSVFVSEIDQGTTALVLVGRGEMTFRPAPDREKTQVRIFSGGAESIATPFDAAYIRINPRDFARLVVSGQLAETAVERDAFRRAGRVFREESPASFALEFGDLSREAWSLVPNPRDLVAEIRTRRFDTLTYSRTTAQREDISLFHRNKGKTVARIIAENDRGRTVGWRDDATNSTYGTTTSTFRDARAACSGRARMKVRIGPPG